MLTYNPTIKKLRPDNILLGSWIDTVNSQIFLDKWKMTVAKNIEFTDLWWEKRDWLTLWGQTWTSSVNWIWVIKRDAWDIFVRAYWTKFQKLVSSTWTDVAWVTLTNIRTTIVSFESADMTSAATATWTLTNDSTTRLAVVSWWGMTINAYAWKILIITSWTGAWQEKLITANDLTTLYTEWLFETTPDATSVFAIRWLIPHVIVTNWTDSVFKYDWTTVTSFSTMTKWQSLEVAHDRLWGAREDSDFVYFSNLATIYFWKDNSIPINPSWDSISAIKRNKEEVIIYKENSRWRIIWYNQDQFQLINADERIWAIAPSSVAHWNNFNFFLWYWGIYSVNSLDNSTIDEWLPISLNINDSVLAHTTAELLAAAWWVYDNKYFLSIWSDTYVYDIEQTQKKKTHVWSIFNYADPITRAFTINGIAYLWSTTKSYYIYWTTDNWTEIVAQVETDRRTQWDENSDKVYWLWYITFEKATWTCNVSVYYSLEWWSYTLLTTQDISSSWNIRIVINKKAKDIKFKYTYWWTYKPKFIKHEQYFTYIIKHT
jgi:hypothetical protein